MTEREKFTEYVKQQMDKGLISMHVDWAPNAAKASEEELFAELNLMIEAPTVPDEEVLGKYSP